MGAVALRRLAVMNYIAWKNCRLHGFVKYGSLLHAPQSCMAVNLAPWAILACPETLKQLCYCLRYSAERAGGQKGSVLNIDVNLTKLCSCLRDSTEWVASQQLPDNTILGFVKTEWK
eukprot:gnl/TRDRNA2_/TRDRNA2_173395_c2_seq11.p1 gnl/TRDRNA2_/TRDRNA2_173395_c2~~gnl/TRDRNA2_/TRDRNA2_173395_c2_seq11.p1  ORF type:complete len:117 (+),score=5.91 gnl/TRDRNA2_/TRDRNA2_173395_c2_seq11:64-414(+)